MGWFNCEFCHSPSPLKCNFFINFLQLNPSITNLFIFGSIKLIQRVHHLGGEILFPLTYQDFQQNLGWYSCSGSSRTVGKPWADVLDRLLKNFSYFIELLMFKWKRLVFVISCYRVPNIEGSFFRRFWPWRFWYFWFLFDRIFVRSIQIIFQIFDMVFQISNLVLQYFKMSLILPDSVFISVKWHRCV